MVISRGGKRSGLVRPGSAGAIMRACSTVIVLIASVVLPSGGDAFAQADPRIALKSGESVDLGPVYWVAACRSIMVGLPEVEILEGPPELTLSLKEAMVLPRQQKCPDKVSGAVLTATAKDVKQPIQARLTYRIKYKTKDGDRQRSGVYSVSLFP
jgi:hypothetical protein